MQYWHFVTKSKGKNNLHIIPTKFISKQLPDWRLRELQRRLLQIPRYLVLYQLNSIYQKLTGRSCRHFYRDTLLWWWEHPLWAGPKRTCWLFGESITQSQILMDVGNWRSAQSQLQRQYQLTLPKIQFFKFVKNSYITKTLVGIEPRTSRFEVCYSANSVT